MNKYIPFCFYIFQWFSLGFFFLIGMGTDAGNEVGGGWALGLSSWNLSSWVNWGLSPPDTSRKKLMAGAELCWSKEINDHIYHSWGQGDLPNCTCTERLLRGQKGRGCYPIIGAVNLPETPTVESILAKKCAHMVRALGQVRCGKQSKIIGQRKTKTQKNCPQISDLNHLSGELLIKEDACTLFLVRISALLLP